MTATPTATPKARLYTVTATVLSVTETASRKQAIRAAGEGPVRLRGSFDGAFFKPFLLPKPRQAAAA